MGQAAVPYQHRFYTLWPGKKVSDYVCSMMDILLCTVPGTFSDRPPLSLGLLKACAQQAGFSATTLDLNIKVLNRINASPQRKEIELFFKQQVIGTVGDTIAELLEYCVDQIVAANPKILGLSLLTQENQFFATWLCYHLRFRVPELRIVIGGSGIKTFIAQSKIDFADFLKSNGLIDDYINGDGEYSIVEYLRNNHSAVGINTSTWNQIEDLNQLPFPDFDDYIWSDYKVSGIPICDSRGCVRSCEFCDIIEHWTRYRYRTAENIFNEMIYQIRKYGITNFFFYNSLTNGNMKEFNLLLDKIVEYNQTHVDRISWDGYFIVRNAKQHPDVFWQKISKSGGSLQLGIESVVEKVRVAMGKNFTNQDIDYHLEMAKKYSVPLLLLMIVGYPTETQQDYEFTKQWLIDRAGYANNTVQTIVLSLAAILPNTQLDKRKTSYGIKQGEIPTIWIALEQQIGTIERVQYYDELTALINNLGMGSSVGNNSVEVARENSL